MLLVSVMSAGSLVASMLVTFRATTGTSPMLQPIPETSRLRVALEDFHMNLCTSRDAPVGCSDHSRPAEAEKEIEQAKQPVPGPRMKGQKPIDKFFIRGPGSGSGSSERHDHAAAGAAAAEGEGAAHLLNNPSAKYIPSANFIDQLLWYNAIDCRSKWGQR